MHAISDRAERQVRKEMTDQREKRIARRVLDAEEIARQDEKTIVLQRHSARRRSCIERKERHGHGCGLQPVCPPRPEWLSRQHQRFAALEPPQAKEAVAKKFHTTAIQAPP